MYKEENILVKSHETGLVFCSFSLCVCVFLIIKSRFWYKKNPDFFFSHNELKLGKGPFIERLSICICVCRILGWYFTIEYSVCRILGWYFTIEYSAHEV